MYICLYPLASRYPTELEEGHALVSQSGHLELSHDGGLYPEGSILFAPRAVQGRG